jgi:hypothetical protein
MRITTEAMTVLLDSRRHEITVVMDGHRIVLGLDEAQRLLQGLSGALSAAGKGRETIPAGATPGDTVDPASLAARIGDQIISWAQISQAITPRR